MLRRESHKVGLVPRALAVPIGDMPVPLAQGQRAARVVDGATNRLELEPPLKDTVTRDIGHPCLRAVEHPAAIQHRQVF